jgi:hypothetical protein
MERPCADAVGVLCARRLCGAANGGGGASGAAAGAAMRDAGGAVVRRRSCTARPARGAPAALRGAGRRKGAMAAGPLGPCRRALTR